MILKKSNKHPKSKIIISIIQFQRQPPEFKAERNLLQKDFKSKLPKVFIESDTVTESQTVSDNKPFHEKGFSDDPLDDIAVEKRQKEKVSRASSGFHENITTTDDRK